MIDYWIVLCSNGIGGAEKRAIKVGVYLAKERRVNVKMLINRALYKHYLADEDISAILSQNIIEVVLAESIQKSWIRYEKLYPVIKLLDRYDHMLSIFPGVYRTLLKIFSMHALLKKLSHKNGIFHCFGTDAARLGLVLNSKRLHNPVIIEVVGNKLLKRMVNQLAVCPVSGDNFTLKPVSESVANNLINIINEKGLETYLQKLSTWKGPFIGEIISQNLNSILNLKENIIIFASRFNGPKNPLIFAKSIKTLLDKQLLANWTILIRGRGVLYDDIREILYDYINCKKVELGFSHNLRAEFIKSKIVVSLIETGNYPSQSLFEAMNCGCVPIVSNTGNSKEKFNSPYVHFVALEEIDLCRKLIELTERFHNGNEDYNHNAREIVAFIKEISDQSEYKVELKSIINDYCI